MKAAGGELGWLTWPPTQEGRSGVSIVLLASPPTPTLPVVGIRLRIHQHGENLQEATHAAVPRTFVKFSCVLVSISELSIKSVS